MEWRASSTTSLSGNLFVPEEKCVVCIRLTLQTRSVSRKHIMPELKVAAVLSLSLAMQLCEQLNLDINDFSKEYVKSP